MGSSSKSFALSPIIIFLTCIVTISFVTVKASSKTIVVPNDYPTIQDAINYANSGDAIIVKSGTYNEQALEINKSLTITSELPYQARLSFHPPTYLQTIGISRNQNITYMVFNNSIHIKANEVKLSGFMITNDAMNFPANSTQMGKIDVGYVLADGDQIQITNNIMGTQEMLFHLDLMGNENQAINNTVAALSISGSYQTVSCNTVRGVDVSGSFNSVTKNSAGQLTLTGANNTVADNSVTTYPGGYGIQLTGADYNFISNNTIICDGPAIGIDMGGSYNFFAGNVVEGAKLWGVSIGSGSYNVFYGNLIANNGRLDYDGHGLNLGGPNEVTNNLFFGNIFMYHSKNFETNWEVIGSNSFDNGAIGNYWNDYLTKYPNATEVGNSGIGNTPYLVYGNVVDHYPLMNKPQVSATLPPLPSPWSTLLTQLPSSTPDEELISIILLTLFIALSLSILVVFTVRKRKNKKLV